MLNQPCNGSPLSQPDPRREHFRNLVESRKEPISGGVQERFGLVGQGPMFRTYCTHPLGNGASNTEG